MPGEFYTFDEVLQQLQIDEDELKRLVSQGELRGYRDGASMKFRRQDVERLKKGRETEPTIILTDSDAEINVPAEEDLLVDERSRDRETVLNMDVFETEEVPAPSKKGLKVPKREEEAPAEIVEVDEGSATIVDAGTPPQEAAPAKTEEEASTRAGSGRISRSARLRTLQMKKKESHIVWTVLIFITTIFILSSGPFIFNNMRSVAPKYAADMSDSVRGLADWFFSMSGE